MGVAIVYRADTKERDSWSCCHVLGERTATVQGWIQICRAEVHLCMHKWKMVMTGVIVWSI